MKEFRKKSKLMGCIFQLGLLHEDKDRANEFLQAGIDEIKRLEQLLSEFIPDSETSKINRFSATEKITIHPDCFGLIARSLSISKLTQGAFDISVSPLKKLYNFKNQQFEMPSKSTIKKALRSVGYQKIKLNDLDKSIRFNHQHLKISFAAIGKGYASDCVKKMWLAEGVNAGYINASGDLNTFGKRSDGRPWKVGIANPNKPNQTLLYLPVQNASVATSGDYEQHFWYKGQRYSHNINPYSGLPLTGIKSVTVCSPSAELSDALATAIYVKGPKKGMDFVNQLPQTHALIIDEENQVHLSKNLSYETV